MVEFGIRRNRGMNEMERTILATIRSMQSRVLNILGLLKVHKKFLQVESQLDRSGHSAVHMDSLDEDPGKANISLILLFGSLML